MEYKNVSEETLMLPGIGVVEPGQIIEVEEGFNNANFEKVGETEIHKPKRRKEESEPEMGTDEELSD